MSALTPAWPRHLAALLTAGAAVAVGVLAVVLWHQVDRDGAITLVNDAIRLDKVTLWIVLVVSVALLLASLISDDPAEHREFFDTLDAPFVGNGFTRWVDGQYALHRPELGLSNWQGGRLFGRGGDFGRLAQHAAGELRRAFTLVAQLAKSLPKHEYEFQVTLLADPDHSVAESYGVWVEKSRYGRTYMGIERSTFVIGADGTVVRALRNVKPATHAEAARRLGLSEGAVKTAGTRLRQRYQELIRAEIRQTVDTEDEVEAELRDLFAAVRA